MRGSDRFDEIVGLCVVEPIAEREEHAWLVPGCADHRVTGVGRAVEVVPLAEAALLAFDDDDARPFEDQEALLVVFAMVEPGRLARRQEVEAGADLVRHSSRLEREPRAATGHRRPFGMARIQDEPALTFRNPSRLSLEESRLTHRRSLATR